MIKALLTISMALILTTTCASADTVYAGNSSYQGKIESVSDGLIILKQKGLLTNFNRSRGDNFYGDYITYRKSPFDKNYEVLPCKVFFVDFYNVNIQTPDTSSIKIPRYRIKDIELRLE